MTALTAPAPAPEATRDPSRSIIGILLVAAFVVILNETTMNVALPSIMADFGVTERLAQWLTTGFMLTMAVVIPITGWLIDRLTTRQMFVLAMGLFSLGTLLSGVAPTFGALLGGRVVQASGTAVMMPLLMTTIMRLVPPHRRGAVMGNTSLVIAVAPAVGPTLSGLLLELGSWRFIFATVLPIAAGMLAVGVWRLRDTGERRLTPLDPLSVALTVLGFGPLVYGMSTIGGDGGGQAAVALAGGVLVLALFVLRQLRLQRTDTALLDLRTFTHPAFTVSLVMMALAMMALFGSIILLPLLLQRSFGLEPLSVGLMMLPGGVAMGLLGPVAGRLYDRLGPRVLVVPGSVAVLGVLAFFAVLSPATPWWAVMTGHIVMSTSFAFVFTPLFTVALGSLPPQLYSHGSALVGTVQQVAGAAGTALFVTVFSVGSAAALAAGEPEASALLTGSHAAFWGAAAVWSLAIVAGFFLRRPTEASPAH